MALWTGLGQAATVAQLVGVDAGGIISMIIQAAVTARQNKKECEQLARRVFMIAELLQHLQDPEVMQREEVRRPLTGLGDTLREAHELVTSCQGRSAMYQFVTAGRQADRFRDVQSRIDSYLLVFPFISHIDITRRLDRIYNILLPNGVPSAAGSQSQLEAAEVAQEVVPLPHGVGAEEFAFAELAAATNNFALDTVIGEGGFTTVYKGRLRDGREVAIKRMTTFSQDRKEAFRNEMAILSPLRHNHIARLFGWSVHEEEPLLVYEYINNGTLHDHLHRQTSSSSPVMTSWKMRIEILLGVSRAIEYLHRYAVPPVIHRDIKSSNVLLDASWVPRVSDFGVSITYDEADEEGVPVCGTTGYIDPEYFCTGRLKPTSDVYSFGMVMLEVLTGKKAITNWDEEMSKDPKSLAIFALPIIEAGELGKMLDRRPAVQKPTPRQLEAAELVAHMAARCLRLHGEDRPTISDVVADLETAIELVRCGEEAAEVAQEVVPLPHGVGAEEFAFAELAAVTNNFALDTVIGEGGSATVYKGRLHDGREVAIKRMRTDMRTTMAELYAEEAFRNEMAILSSLRHMHIVRLFGWSMQKEKRRLLWFRNKKDRNKEEERLLVFEYMNNGTLHDHLHRQTSSSSPVTTSWKMRIEILLGVSRAIEHLHCYAVPPVIHGDIKSSNVLLDARWVPCVADFGLSVTYDEADEKEVPMRGTIGYIAPEYLLTRRVKPTSDVYSFGVVMLEVLTGKKAYLNWEEEESKPSVPRTGLVWEEEESEPSDSRTSLGEPSDCRTSLVIFTLPFIEAGELAKVLDRRPAVLKPTPRQLEAAELVARTAARCLQLREEDRPAMSDVVADLETALELVR